MAWPTDDLSTTHLDSDGASPLLARPQLLAAINKIKAMLGFTPAKAGPLGESGISGAAAAGAISGSGLTMGAGKILGRTTAGSGAMEEISIGAGLALAGGSLACTVAAPVSSVFGRTGAVTLGAGDVVGALGFAPTSIGHNHNEIYTGVDVGSINTIGFVVSGTGDWMPTLGGVYGVNFLSQSGYFAIGNWDCSLIGITPISGSWRFLGVVGGTFRCFQRIA